MDPSSMAPHPSSTFPAPISLFPVNYGAIAAPITTTNTAPFPPTQRAAPTANHPRYSKVIYAATEILREKNGSSKRAIAKYIEQAYPNLPLTASDEEDGEIFGR
ncbi:hypothetical protein K1719_003516 [Acacia pycnantha]|nr:hypothetical protein K1719_003516 [Acacia pycnantha]